jgi:ubiquinone/menaquinone biosynthesis C-methylase UbiE
MTADAKPTWERYTAPPAELYERHFVPAVGRPFADRVVDAASPRAGEQCLDVACGTGVVARLAAERVGETGAVVGVDGHPGMLATARATSNDIDWQQASAEGLPFEDDRFDVVLCSLGLQFFTDKPAALAEMLRVLRPGGRVAVATVGPTPEPFRVLREVLRAHLGDHVAAFIDAVFSLDDTDRLRALLSGAGFEGVDATRATIASEVDPPADFFWQYAFGTPLAEHALRLDVRQRAELEREVVAQWERFATDSGMLLTADIVLGTAHASS